MPIAVSLPALEDEVLNHPALRHPFLRRFSRETLSLEQIRAFGLQHYQLVRVFTTYMTNLTARVPAWSETLRPVLDDEFGGHSILRSHVHLYRDFLQALGLAPRDWGSPRLQPETRGFIDAHLELTRDGDILEALGAVGPGHELAIPVMFEFIVAGLRRGGYGLSARAIEYFPEHITQDQHHRHAFNTLIEAADEPDALERVRRGALRSLELRARFWEGCTRAVFGGSAHEVRL